MQHVDKRRQAKNIGQQNELMSCFIGDLSGSFKELDSGLPFGMGQFHVPGKGVQMVGQALHDLAHARVGVLAEIFHEDIGDIVGCDVAHSWFLKCRVTVSTGSED